MTWRSVLTTTTPNTSYRGAGRPEAAAALERTVDLFAAEIGMDPAEVRRRNYVPPEAFPYTTPVGTTYDCGDYPAASRWRSTPPATTSLRAEQARRRESGEGRCSASAWPPTSRSPDPAAGAEFGSIELLPDGRFRVVTGSTPYGQGHVTTWAMLAADRLGVPDGPHRRRPRRHRHGAVGRRDRWLPVGADGRLGGGRRQREAGGARPPTSPPTCSRPAPPTSCSTRSGGEFHVVGTPAVSVGWEPVATARAGDPLETISDLTQEGSTFPFGTHIAVVEIDPEPAHVELTRFVAVDDAGTIINPLLAHGQVHGGIAQGVAQALIEEVLFDEDGNPLTSTFADYGDHLRPRAALFEVLTMETPTPLNPLGAKGIGESGTIGATPAVQNAVVDALSHLGVRHVDIPCTAQRVWAAIRDVG